MVSPLYLDCHLSLVEYPLPIDGNASAGGIRDALGAYV
jgi:hypothetical protein